MFDPTADPEAIAARAAELSLEQMDRLRGVLEDSDDPAGAQLYFYKNIFEINICNQIARLMSAYAVLKGYVTAEQAGVTQ